jgi:AcrR family transcriptional regulator
VARGSTPPVSGHERGKRERRERILDAAEALVREAGGVAFGMRELAERAGLSQATPFNLFGSKGAILAALVERSLEVQHRELAATRGADPMDRVLQLADRTVRAYTEDEALYRPLLRALVGASGRGAPAPLLEPCTELWRASLREAEQGGLLDPDLDVDLVARQLHLEYRAGLLLWVSGETDDRGWRLHVVHGVTLVLLAVVREPLRPRLRALLLETQREMMTETGSAAAPSRRRERPRRAARRPRRAEGAS